MSLAKALKYKNELIRMINETRTLIVKHNSYDSRNAPKFNLVISLGELIRLTELLADLKAQITKANAGIISDIALQCEYRSLIATLNTIPVDEGFSELDSYSSSLAPRTIEKKVHINEPTIVKQQEGLRLKISELQDKIDAYNAVTTVDVFISDKL